MRTILFVLYIVVTGQIVDKLQGIQFWLSAAFLCLMIWVASKEERLEEKKREEWEEKIEGILLEIKLNQRVE